MTWMTLKSSLVIFQTLEPLQPRWPHRPLRPHWPQQPRQHYFIKELHNPNDLIIPGTKLTDNGPFLWNESSKIHFSLISTTLFVGCF